MPDILLAVINAKWIHPSLALRLLKANLGELEENCEIMEFALRQPINEKLEPILASKPKILGLSVSVWNHIATLELLKCLYEKWQENNYAAQRPVIVLGGPELSGLKEAEIFFYADYIILGEGEKSFRDLCQKVLFAGEKTGEADMGSAMCLPGKPVFINDAYASAYASASASTEENLNDLSFPYRLYTELDLQKKHIYVEASRGCPYNCEYCHGSHTKGIREFPLDDFLSEMEKILERGGRTFKFLDRCFNHDTDRAIKIMNFFLSHIESEKFVNNPFCVHFEMLPFCFPLELKETIMRFPKGTLRLEIGIQTLNPQTRKLIKRSSSSYNIDDELGNLEFLAQNTNAILHVDLIAGLPGEDMESFGKGFDRLWQALNKDNSQILDSQTSNTKKRLEIQIGILKGLPGTPILKSGESMGMIYSPMPPYEVIQSGVMPALQMDKLKNFARFWEIIVNRNHFSSLLPLLLPAGEDIFDRFMKISSGALEYFGRNWGINRDDLFNFLRESDF